MTVKKNTIQCLTATALMLVLAADPLSSQTVAKYAGEFMAIGVGGRALGLGGSYAALANDASAGYWNPAALVRLTYPEVMIMHDERFGNLINYDFASIGLPYGPDGSLGLSVLRLGIDGIPDTRKAWVDANGNGVFDDNTRPDYDKVSYFNAADWAVYFTYARESSSDFFYGANLKIIYRTIAEHSATGIGFDVGLLYSPLTDFFVGVNLQDITTTFVAWTTGRNELISPTVKVGSAYFVELLGGRFAPTLDVDVRFENRRSASIAHLGAISADPRVGLEFDFRKMIALRIGYNDIRQVTFGAGIHLRKLDIDYSFARFNAAENIGNTHRISLRLLLEEERFARSR
jgi:hypothetical protein